MNKKSPSKMLTVATVASFAAVASLGEQVDPDLAVIQGQDGGIGVICLGTGDEHSLAWHTHQTHRVRGRRGAVLTVDTRHGIRASAASRAAGQSILSRRACRAIHTTGRVCVQSAMIISDTTTVWRCLKKYEDRGGKNRKDHKIMRTWAMCATARHLAGSAATSTV